MMRRMVKEDKAKYNRTTRHYCAEKKCTDCETKGVYDCCQFEIDKESKENKNGNG